MDPVVCAGLRSMAILAVRVWILVICALIARPGTEDSVLFTDLQALDIPAAKVGIPLP
jgi:hypothetical protein